MPFQTITNQYQSTKFIVTRAGAGPYTTIQAALNAANTEAIATGTPQTVFVRPGTYTENLTLYSTVSIRGEEGLGVVIVGMHTPDPAGTIVISHCYMSSATHILNTANAGVGAGVIAFDHCLFNLTNGYIFNMTNWTSELNIVFCGDESTANGIINNTALAPLGIGYSYLGITNPLTMNGALELEYSTIGCGVILSGAAESVIYDSLFYTTLTFQNTAYATITHTTFDTGAAVALATTSTGVVTLSDVTIDSNAVNTIAGTGTVELGSVTYVGTSSGIQGTITKTYVTRLETGVLKLSDATVGTLIATAGVVSALAPLTVGYGGIGVNTLTLHGILMGNGANAIQATAEPLNGQILIGKTGDFPQLASLQPGPGISITSGAGTCTVSAWGGGLSWTQKGASTPLVINNAFICNAGGALAFSLPGTSSIGDMVALTLDGSGSWQITQAGGQRIRIGALETTLGAGGSLTSTAQGDTIYLLCVTANTRWVCTSVFGNITVV